MNQRTLLLAHFPTEMTTAVCQHARIYVGIIEQEEEGMYQIGWAMYFFDDADHTVASEQEPMSIIKPLSLSPDELNAALDSFQALPSIYGDDELSCDYKLIVSH